MSDETVAGAILEMVLGGSAEVSDTGRVPGIHDLELFRDGIAFGCVEVTSTVVGGIAAFRNTLQKKGRSIPAPELSSTWSLLLDQKSPLKSFEKHRDLLIAILREFEESGNTNFSILRLDEDHPRIQELWVTFGVCHGRAIEDAQESQAEILLGEAPSGRAYGVADVVTAVEREVAKEDNILKLQNCPHAERHFFVFIDADTDVGTRLAMKLPGNGMAGLPDPPRLSQAINETTVWVATWIKEKTYNVWRCRPGDGWEVLGDLGL